MEKWMNKYMEHANKKDERTDCQMYGHREMLIQRDRHKDG
jgi:hypothetical protein